MTITQDATCVVSEALSKLGLQAPNPMTESLSITLQDDTVIRIDVFDDGKRICAWHELLRWPAPEEEAELLENLLRLHTFGTATNGATFAANREAGRIVVFKSFPTAHLTPDWFAEELESLVTLIAEFQGLAMEGKLISESVAASGSRVPAGIFV
jgi:hypothetical protein